VNLGNISLLLDPDPHPNEQNKLFKKLLTFGILKGQKREIVFSLFCPIYGTINELHFFRVCSLFRASSADLL
jgi:hypothetical protein